MIKRIWIKLTAVLLIAGAVLGYSVWKNHFAEKDPDLREMKRFLKSASAADAEKLSLKYSRVENRFFRKKKFAEVRRLNQLMREYGGKVSFPNYFYDFSDYTSYVGERDYSRALETLKRIETMPGQSPEVRGAILGEQIRCIAERDGIDAASREFKSRIAEAAQPMFRPAYTAYINTLYRHRRPDEALQATLEAGERILPEAGTPPFVARLGGDLLRNGKDERRLAELIPPEKRKALTNRRNFLENRMGAYFAASALSGTVTIPAKMNIAYQNRGLINRAVLAAFSNFVLLQGDDLLREGDFRRTTKGTSEGRIIRSPIHSLLTMRLPRGCIRCGICLTRRLGRSGARQ